MTLLSALSTFVFGMGLGAGIYCLVLGVRLLRGPLK